MKRIMTTLATAVAFAGLSLSAQAATVKTKTVAAVKPHEAAVVARNISKDTESLTSVKAVKANKAVKSTTYTNMGHKKATYSKTSPASHKGKAKKSTEVNMDIPADLKINQTNSLSRDGVVAEPVNPVE